MITLIFPLSEDNSVEVVFTNKINRDDFLRFAQAVQLVAADIIVKQNEGYIDGDGI